MQTSFMQMTSHDDDDPDVKKARDAEQCKALADETVAGQPASVYQTHNPESGVDTKIWFSKSTRLPIKSEMTTDVGAMKSFTVSRYEYTNTQAPANAMTMRDMMKARARK